MPKPALSPKAQLDGFLDKFTPEVAAQARTALAKMRKRLPGAVELVYDNYNALAIAFGAGEKLADVVFSIAVYPKWVSLFLVGGPDLDDPKKLLKGSGGTMRHIVLDPPDLLDDPAVRKLMAQSLKLAGLRLDDKSNRKLVIKSISAKQRPRRPQR
jgi:hypothetical protein